MSLATTIQNHFSQADWALITPEQLALAEAQALEAYSQQQPRVLVADRLVFKQMAILPSEWINGFSQITHIEYPISDYPVTPIAEDGSTRYRFPVAESITAGMPVRLSSDSLLFQAAASLERFDVVGVVVLAETTHATYTSDGKVELEDWTTIVGQPLLTPGESYFLQLTPGLLDTTPPADAPVVQVGRAMSGTQLDVEIEITL